MTTHDLGPGGSGSQHGTDEIVNHTKKLETWSDMGTGRVSNTLADNPLTYTLPCNKNMEAFIQYMEGVPGTDVRYTAEYDSDVTEDSIDMTGMNPIIQGIMLVKSEDRRLKEAEQRLREIGQAHVRGEGREEPMHAPASPKDRARGNGERHGSAHQRGARS